MPPRNRGHQISDQAVTARTGRNWLDWFTWLDQRGARTQNHRQIVALLSSEPNVNAWWRQMIAVSYEQSRGLRQRHQKESGYEISCTRTIAAPAAALFRALTTAQAQAAWLGKDELTIRTSVPARRLRANWANTQTIIEARLTPTPSGKTQVTVQHMKLPDARAAARFKEYWRKRLMRLARLVEG